MASFKLIILHLLRKTRKKKRVDDLWEVEMLFFKYTQSLVIQVIVFASSLVSSLSDCLLYLSKWFSLQFAKIWVVKISALNLEAPQILCKIDVKSWRKTFGCKNTYICNMACTHNAEQLYLAAMWCLSGMIFISVSNLFAFITIKIYIDTEKNRWLHFGLSTHY
jgi:hypothetical protein